MSVRSVCLDITATKEILFFCPCCTAMVPLKFSFAFERSLWVLRVWLSSTSWAPSGWRKLAEGSCPFGACQNIYLHTVDHPDVEHDKCSAPPCTGVTWERDKGGEAAPIRSLWMDLHKEHLWAVQQIHTFSGSSHHKWISGLTWQSHIIKTYLHARYPRSALY